MIRGCAPARDIVLAVDEEAEAANHESQKHGGDHDGVHAGSAIGKEDAEGVFAGSGDEADDKAG